MQQLPDKRQASTRTQLPSTLVHPEPFLEVQCEELNDCTTLLKEEYKRLRKPKLYPSATGRHPCTPIVLRRTPTTSRPDSATVRTTASVTRPVALAANPLSLDVVPKRVCTPFRKVHFLNELDLDHADIAPGAHQDA